MFVVILFDDDGNVENKKGDKDEMDPSIRGEKRSAFVRDMLEIVGDKNRTDLVKAIDKMQKKAYELGKVSLAKAVGEGASLGAASGYAISGAWEGAALGAVTGAAWGNYLG